MRSKRYACREMVVCKNDSVADSQCPRGANTKLLAGRDAEYRQLFRDLHSLTVLDLARMAICDTFLLED